MNNKDGIMLSEEKKKEDAFKELKRRICDEFGEKEADCSRLLRFLRARNFDVSAAEAMLRNNIAWRKAEKLDTYFQNYENPEVFKKYLSLYMTKLGPGSAPVMVYHFGATDLKGILKCEKKDAVLKYVTFIMELSEKQLKESSEILGKQLDKCVFVINFDNSTLFQVTNKACIDVMLSACACYEANYPERLEKAIVINGTTYFNIVFNILKNILSPTTISKVKTFGRDGWQEELRKIVSPEIMSILQGESNDHLVSPSCVITDFNHGGKVPKRYYSRSHERRICFKEGVIKCILKRNQKIDVPVDVTKPKSFLEWKFETENYDIAFGLSYKKTDDVTEKRKALIPMQKFEADMGYEAGSYMCQELGTYILTFDNTYSWFRRKQLYYSISVVDPEKDEYIIDKLQLK